MWAERSIWASNRTSDAHKLATGKDEFCFVHGKLSQLSATLGDCNFVGRASDLGHGQVGRGVLVDGRRAVVIQKCRDHCATRVFSQAALEPRVQIHALSDENATSAVATANELFAFSRQVSREALELGSAARVGCCGWDSLSSSLVFFK